MEEQKLQKEIKQKQSKSKHKWGKNNFQGKAKLMREKLKDQTEIIHYQINC